MAARGLALIHLEEQKVSLDGCAFLRETRNHPATLEDIPEMAQLAVDYLPMLRRAPVHIVPRLFSSHSFTLRSAVWAAVGWEPFTNPPTIPGVLDCYPLAGGRRSLIVAGPEKGRSGKPWNKIGFFTLHMGTRDDHTSVLVVPLPVWQMAEELVKRGLPPILPHYAVGREYVYNLPWDAPCVGGHLERFLSGLCPQETKIIGGLLNGWYFDTPGSAGVYPHNLRPQWVEKLIATGRELAQRKFQDLSWERKRDMGLLYARRIPMVLETQEKRFEYRKITDLQTTGTGSLVSIEVTACGPQGEIEEESPISYAPPHGQCNHIDLPDEDFRYCVECACTVCEECGRVCEGCENWVCRDHWRECEGCSVFLCDQCDCRTCFNCESCGDLYPEESWRQCGGCGR